MACWSFRGIWPWRGRWCTSWYRCSVVLDWWRFWTRSLGSYHANAAADWCRSREEMAILGAFFSSVGSAVASITICHCGSRPEAFYMVSDQFLWNGDRLVRCTSKVMAESVFWTDFARLTYFLRTSDGKLSMDEFEFLVCLGWYCEGEFWPGRSC